MSINVLYLFIITVAGKIRSSKSYGVNPTKKKIAVLIPSYREDDIVLNTARQAKQHDYPSDKFDVFFAAHHLKKETIEALRRVPVNVLEVEFELGSKARSLNALLNYLPENEYEIAMILDADNVMLPGMLEQVNDAFQQGFRCVQCHRIAKNRNTPVAVLDAMSEEINNHFFRKGLRSVGLSATVIGSGMAFEFKKLKEIYNKPGILGNPACDREVDFETMKAGIQIEFIEKAFVLDEKVANRAVYERQRTRWLESQIIHLKLFFDKAQGHLPKTADYWNKLFLNLIPPRLIFLASFTLILFIVALQYLFNFYVLAPGTLWWLGLTALYFSTFLIAIPGSFYNKKTLQAIFYIPVLMVSMLKALFKMKVSRKEFLHTPKTFTQK
ncbi:MAG: glycosyltransferase [Chitinophagaceae bacterium]|nr:glycosyltransferase [Chitinophagaceae bacterium]